MDTSQIQIKNPNKRLAFKCLHYSVTESAGTVGIKITKKVKNSVQTFGVRCVADSADPKKDYVSIDK